MKKFIAVILCMVMIIAALQIGVSAEVKSYKVPKAAALPTIDGVVDATEWNNALVVEMKAGDASIAAPAGDIAQFLGTTFRFMWSPEGIWFAAEVKDTTEATAIPTADSGSYNSGDGVQFNMFPNNSVASGNGTILFLSYHPKTSDGKPYVGEHFCYGDGASGKNVPEGKIASKFVSGGYVVEGLIPKEALAKTDPAFAFGKEGDVLYWNNVIMEEGGSFAQGLFCDGEWFAAGGANMYTLTGDVAGKVETPVVAEETPAETPVEAPAAETPAPAKANPTTGDSGLYIFAVLMVAAAGAYIYTKKSSAKA